jgi:hypothetical protein
MDAAFKIPVSGNDRSADQALLARSTIASGRGPEFPMQVAHACPLI